MEALEQALVALAVAALLAQLVVPLPYLVLLIQVVAVEQQALLEIQELVPQFLEKHLRHMVKYVCLLYKM
jgi:sensor domain CHASE-containing protein